MSGEMNGPVVEMKGVWARYNANWVLEAVDFDILEKEIVAVVGPNGGGKSTLLKVMLGILKPERGEVRVFGRPPAEARGRIGFLPQIATYKRNFPVSALDVVLMGSYGRLGLFRRPRDIDRERARALLHEVGLGHIERSPFGSLSGGQQQRVGIARALASEPSLLLLDEPVTGVDIAAQEAFFRFLSRLRDERGISMIIVSHDIGAITPIVDRVAWLNRVIHYYGEPGGALEPSVIERTFGKDVRFLVHGDHCATCRRPDRA